MKNESDKGRFRVSGYFPKMVMLQLEKTAKDRGYRTVSVFLNSLLGKYLNEEFFIINDHDILHLESLEKDNVQTKFYFSSKFEIEYDKRCTLGFRTRGEQLRHFVYCVYVWVS